jgi:Ribonuclease G/E
MNKLRLNKQNASFARPQGKSKKEVKEDFAELMQRLLEIQSGGRQRNPGLIAEDERVMDRSEKRTLAGKRP